VTYTRNVVSDSQANGVYVGAELRYLSADADGAPASRPRVDATNVEIRPRSNGASVRTAEAWRVGLHASATPALALVVRQRPPGVVLDPVLLPYPRPLRSALPSRLQSRLHAFA
jgi:hypothetical protein